MSFAPTQRTIRATASDAGAEALINHHRREIVLLMMGARRLLKVDEYRESRKVIWEMFTSSLIIEPDGAGLPCLLEAARERLRPLRWE